MKNGSLNGLNEFALKTFKQLKCPSKTLLQAMDYSFFSGGKRIRARLVYIIGRMFDLNLNDCHKIAFAIEAIHTYSLIHDDLPAMDNDSLRRGKATCHIKFNEAVAILAGDALQSLAFEVLQKIKINDIKTLKKINITLAQCSGSSGMVAGQQLDLEGENSSLTFDELELIHNNKTAKMFKASILLPYYLTEQNADPEIISLLKKIALTTGLCFQIKDDILDVTKSTAELGKTSAKDIDANKSTYVSLLGLENAKIYLQEKKLEINLLISQLENINIKCDELREIISLVINRNY